MENKKKWIALLVVIACALAIYPCVMLMKQKAYVRLEENGYQNMNGVTISFSEGEKLTDESEEDRSITIREKDHSEVLDLPIYMSKGKRFMLPMTYALVNYDKNTMHKVNRFAMIQKGEEGYFVEEGNDETLLHHAFFFDGADTYIFLQEIDVKFGEVSQHLSPFSYVRIIHGELQMYDPLQETYSMEVVENKEVSVQLEDHTVLRLDTDTLSIKDTQTMLFCTPTHLPNLD